MIEKMKKFTFLVTESEYDSFISNLRQQGVVHIEQLQQGATSEELQAAITLEQRYRAALGSLEILEGRGYTFRTALAASEPVYEEPAKLLERVEQLQRDENSLLHQIDAVHKDIVALMPWGEFAPEDIKRISEVSSLQVCFFRCGAKSMRAEWAEDLYATVISEVDKYVYFITFSHEVPDIQAERIFLPQLPLSEALGHKEDLEAQLETVRQQMLDIQSRQRTLLCEGLVAAQNDINLSRVHLSDERVASGVLRLMVGWVRADRTAPLVEYLDQASIYYEMSDPAYEDDVPVQITNGKFSSLFEPILRMYSLPNYTDLDPTEFFAPFFMLFFGLCLGDAGYGVLVLVIGLYLALKGSEGTRSYGRLASWLGLSTIICGLATGTVFGVDISSQPWAWIEPFKPYFLNDNGVGPMFGYTPMMVISVIIGLVQVLLGMILKGCKAIKNYGWPYAVGTFSWVVAIISAVVLYGMPECGVVLSESVQYVLLGVIAVSSVGIFLYNNPASYKRPALGLLSNIGGGIWSTYGMATGLLGDLLSYIRLFALGLTGGVLGGVFNSLALDMTSSMSLAARIPVMILILLAGHGITFALSMISAFVHPMRLTFVEFFKNADFSGGGKEYKPFEEIKL